MSIILRKIQRVNPQDRGAAKKWYPVLVTVEQLDETKVSEEISDETTLNPNEALMSIRQLYKVVLNAVLNGKSVRLGNWGSFYASIEGSPAETRESLTANNVERVRIIFRPGKDMKDALAKATFTWAENLDGVSSAGDDDEEGSEPGNDDGPEVQ